MPFLDCILCLSSAQVFQEVGGRPYYLCSHCGLVFLDPAKRLSPDQEESRYRLHENDPSDNRYRQFLNQLAQPLLKKIAAGSRGLDYGCGPGPTLHLILQEAGMSMELYDLYFKNQPHVLKEKYDFLVSSETIEHFREPRKEFERFSRIVKPSGWIALMTGILSEPSSFSSWHYMREDTHIVFYQQSTMEWLAKQHRWNMENPTKNVYLFQLSKGFE